MFLLIPWSLLDLSLTQILNSGPELTHIEPTPPKPTPTHAHTHTLAHTHTHTRAETCKHTQTLAGGSHFKVSAKPLFDVISAGGMRREMDQTWGIITWLSSRPACCETGKRKRSHIDLHVVKERTAYFLWAHDFQGQFTGKCVPPMKLIYIFPDKD